MAAARAGAAGRRRLKAISLGVENARPAMRTVRITGDSTESPAVAPTEPQPSRLDHTSQDICAKEA